MNRTKIEWCDSTWNPVTGCRNDCEYCYARRIAERFSAKEKDKAFYDGKPYTWVDGDELHELEEPATTFDGFGKDIHGFVTPKWRKELYPFGFEPTFHRYKLSQPKKWKKPRTVFVCSMADLFGKWVPESWIRDVMDACCAAPQHRYMFLTKNPERYGDVIEYLKTCLENNPDIDIPDMWFGATVTTNTQLSRAYESDAVWISVEPILDDISDEFFTEFYHDGTSETERNRWQWIVIGAETGNRKDKVTPQKEWIDTICETADSRHTPVFMKDSLIPIMGEENMRREFP